MKERRRIVKARIIDRFQKPDSTSVPFDYDGAPKVPIYSAEAGMDYGAILLKSFFVRTLHAGGVRAFDEKWYEDCPDEADKYYLLGFPSEAREIEHINNDDNDGRIRISIGCPLISIQRVYEPPAELRLAEERFYARVPIIEGNIYSVDGEVVDIEGMSGGPIIGVKTTADTTKYRIVAVQSRLDE